MKCFQTLLATFISLGATQPREKTLHCPFLFKFDVFKGHISADVDIPDVYDEEVSNVQHLLFILADFCVK